MKTAFQDTETATPAAIFSHPAVAQLKRELVREAEEKYGLIRPVGHRESLDECFTVFGRYLLFWFNTPRKTTRVLRREIPF